MRVFDSTHLLSQNTTYSQLNKKMMACLTQFFWNAQLGVTCIAIWICINIYDSFKFEGCTGIFLTMPDKNWPAANCQYLLSSQYKCIFIHQVDQRCCSYFALHLTCPTKQKGAFFYPALGRIYIQGYYIQDIYPITGYMIWIYILFPKWI